MRWQKIEVASSKSYPICLGASLEELGQYLEQRVETNAHIIVISNPVVSEYYAEKVMSGLTNFQADQIIVPAGEEEKSLQRLEWITGEALKLGADRKTLVLALGGGVIGDLAGFFASIFMRGIRLIQIPTTLLAQVDSSIGGKVAVNHPGGKNLIGAFYPPLAVWTDFSTLQTLPWKEVLDGLAETIKHALIADRELFEFIQSHQKQIIERDTATFKEMTSRSLMVKVRIVSEDEKEEGKRMLLNFGHSFGHALETELAYRGITHGQGVSIGMVAAANLAKARGIISSAEVDKLINLLESFGLPTSIDKDKDHQKLVTNMQADKKNRGGQKILILPKGLGQAVICKDCSDEEIVEAWMAITK
ncbi:MAG: 3-dehydroquinate synthase [Desulfitobacterium hafniense]|nr:3-dehydroquinate synthase [Desulfitobacterium hafniense]